MQDINDFLKGFTPKSEDEFTPLPEGDYDAIVDSVKIESKENGSFAALCYKVTGPTQANRLVWDNCWLTHKNPKANEVGRGKLYKLATICGLDPNTVSKDDYIAKKVTITVTIRDGKYNDVKRVSKQEASTPAPVAKPAATVSAPSVQSDDGEVW